MPIGIGLMLISSWGCGGDVPGVSSSLTEAKVSGKVTIKGQPAKQGNVTFNPANVNRKVGSRTAPIKDGTYEITTLVGGNAVSVDGTKDPAAGAYNTKNFDVPAGSSTLDLDLPFNAAASAPGKQ